MTQFVNDDGMVSPVLVFDPTHKLVPTDGDKQPMYLYTESDICKTLRKVPGHSKAERKLAVSSVEKTRECWKLGCKKM